MMRGLHTQLRINRLSPVERPSGSRAVGYLPLPSLACPPLKATYQDLLQIAPNNREALLMVSVVYAAMPKRLWMNWRCPTTSPFGSQRICPFRIRCIAS
jgi:hypothetical protein